MFSKINLSVSPSQKKIAASFRCSDGGDLLEASGEFLALIGLKEFSEVNLYTILASANECDSSFYGFANDGFFSEIEINFRNFSGRIIRAKFITHLVLSKDSKLTYYEGIATDLTPYEQVFKNLIDSRKRLQFALESANHCIWNINLETGHVDFSETFYSMLGYKNDELFPSLNQLAELIHPDDKSFLTNINIDFTIGKIDQVESEYRIKSKNNNWLWFHTNTSIVEKDAAGNAKKIICTNSDISERMAIHEKLRESEIKYRSLFEVSADAIFLIDIKDGRIIDSNESACRIYGYTIEEILNLTVYDISTEPDKTLQSIKSNEAFVPFRLHKKKDGTIFPVEISFSRFEHYNTQISTTIVRDISWRVDYEHQLKEAKEFYEKLIITSPISILTISLADKISFASPNSAKLFKSESPESLIGLNFIELLKVESQHFLVSSLNEFQLNGKVKQIDVSALTITGLPIELELNIAPLRNKSDEINGYMIAAMDISQRIKAEKQLKLSMKTVIEAESQKYDAMEIISNTARLASIGAMSASITHEINQPLNAIKIGASGIINWNKGNGKVLPEVISTLLGGIFQATERIEEIIKHIRSFWEASNKTVKQVVDINALIYKAVSLSTNRLQAYDIISEFELENKPCFIFADPKQLEMSINILINYASHSLNKVKSKNKVIKFRTNDTGLNIFFSIEDNGAGLPDAPYDQLFDAFAANDKLLEGNGLGLAIVKMYTDIFGAEVKASNRPEGGSIFQIRFIKVNPEQSNV